MCYSAYSLITSFTLILPLHIIYFLHLLSTNHKCTHPCYFPLSLKPAAQKLRRFEVLRYGILGEQLAPVDCMWSYGVFPL
jgi:hypothetical protein